MITFDQVTDWYLPQEDPTKGFYYPGPSAIEDQEDFIEHAVLLGVHALEKTRYGNDEFVLRDGSSIFRGHKVETVEGTLLFYVKFQTPSLKSKI